MKQQVIPIKKNSELPKLRISSELKNKISKTLSSLNQNESQLKITLPTFRRMALDSFCSKILSEGLEIVLTPTLQRNSK